MVCAKDPCGIGVGIDIDIIGAAKLCRKLEAVVDITRTPERALAGDLHIIRLVEYHR